MTQPTSTHNMPARMNGKRHPVCADNHAPRICVNIPHTQTGMLMACAVAAFQPSSVRMVGMNADMEAAVMSQQKNMSVGKRIL